jgi:hypothetical protein
MAPEEFSRTCKDFVAAGEKCDWKGVRVNFDERDGLTITRSFAYDSTGAKAEEDDLADEIDDGDEVGRLLLKDLHSTVLSPTSV